MTGGEVVWLGAGFGCLMMLVLSGICLVLERLAPDRGSTTRTRELCCSKMKNLNELILDDDDLDSCCCFVFHFFRAMLAQKEVFSLRGRHLRIDPGSDGSDLHRWDPQTPVEWDVEQSLPPLVHFLSSFDPFPHF